MLKIDPFAYVETERESKIAVKDKGKKKK